MVSNRKSLLPWAGMFALALLMWVVTTCWPHIRNEMFVLIGNRNEAGGYYGFWSGFGGATRDLEYFVIAAAVYWHHTCHYSAKCLRWGKYQAADGLFKLCHHHHPDLAGARPTREMIDRLHRERSCGTR